MADSPHAIRVSLNRRAKEVGLFDQELTMEELAAVRSFYDFTCLKCGKKPATSIDHVQALKDGGQNTLDNLQLLCTNCNKAKGMKHEDYRKGNIVPADYVAENTSEPDRKETYKKHDWDAIQHEYITTDKSMRELSKEFQVHENQLMNRAVLERWHKKREIFTSNLLAEANDEVSRRAVKLVADEKFDVLKEGIALYKDAVERWQIGGNKVDLREIVELWKPLAAALGETTDRKAVNVADEPDDNAIFARINRLFDGGQEERIGPADRVGGEETGAGWTD